MIVVNFKGLPSYGYRGHRHPRLPQYWWVRWHSGLEGYYAEHMIRIVGTDFAE